MAWLNAPRAGAESATDRRRTTVLGRFRAQAADRALLLSEAPDRASGRADEWTSGGRKVAQGPDYRQDVVSDQPPTPPTAEELESWAGRGRVLRATETDVAAWRLPPSAKAALIFSGVPLLDELVHEVSFRGASRMYRLALGSSDGPAHPAWEYGAVPETGEVRLWPADGSGHSSFVNSSISHWLCSLHLVGSRLTESAVIDRWDESAEAEEQALAELSELLRRIEAIDPAAKADGHHEQQFWPAVLDRWLY